MMRIRYGMAALVAGTFLIAGCGGDPVATSGTEDGAGSAAAAPAAAQPREALDAGRTGTTEQAGKDAAGGSGGGSGGGDRKVAIQPEQRSIIYTAQMSVRVKDVQAAADRARAIVTGAGGYVAEEKSSSLSSGDRAVITFKVPPAGYPDVIAQLSRDLGKRESMHQDTEDVTEEVADVDSRVKSAKSALDQFRTLLSDANKIGEILQIEREISDREAELESLQARQKSLAAQTGMATVTLTLAPPVPGPVKKKPKEETSGFLSGLKAGWRALVASAKVALTVVGVLLPWLVLGGVIWVVTVVIWRRLHRDPAAPPQAHEQLEPVPAGAPSGPGAGGPPGPEPHPKP
ncbi:DUF4349 domain-containing protein [Microbispora sp. NPDC049125]|uniref:DUF4349 domain-containing protein n=1 Tax=Microbispora sp. NPDC049125 TaxID=3154929 RepID=UPI00346575BE